MAITTAEIEFRLSGGAANVNPNAALGGAMSTVAGGVITSGALNNLFDNVSGDEALAGDIEYRAFYVQQRNATLTWTAVKAWIATLSPSPDTVFAISLATEGKNGTMQSVANEATSPAGQTFSSPITKSGGLAVPDLAPNEFIGVWLRRTVSAAAAAIASDGPTIRIEGDTPA